MKIQRALEEIGLNKNEAKLYTSLSRIGITTTTKLIKDTGINSSKVYENLERLLKKGLVSYSIIKNKKHWVAEDPKKLLTFLEEEQKKLEQRVVLSKNILPALRTARESKKTFTQYSIFEGIKGIKTAREKVFEELKQGDTLYIILSTYPNIEKMEGYWIDFQKRRSEKGIKCKYIFNQELKELAKKRLTLRLADARFVKSEVLSPTWIEIYGEYVGIGIMNENPSIFLVRNKETAKGFISQFKHLWKIGEK